MDEDTWRFGRHMEVSAHLSTLDETKLRVTLDVLQMRHFIHFSFSQVATAGDLLKALITKHLISKAENTCSVSILPRNRFRKAGTACGADVL